MSARAVALALSLVALLPARAEEAVSGATLRFDPFRALDSPPSSSGYAPGVQEMLPLDPALRGTLAAGERSLANLGGVVIRLGEEAGGYRLVEVREREAVFVKDGVELTLHLDPSEQQAP